MYNNPINFVLILLTVLGILKGKKHLGSQLQPLFLWLSIPFIILFLFISLFRSTLPHWTGPAYTTLIIPAAARLSSRFPLKNNRLFLPKSIKSAFFVLLIPLIIGVLHINYGIIPFKDKNEYHRIGKQDLSLDMFGWKQLRIAFEEIRDREVIAGRMNYSDALVGENWFPLAHLDYYVARPLGTQALGLGAIDKLHNYYWINDMRGGFHTGNNYWFITNSRDFKEPEKLFHDFFERIIPTDTIEIHRSAKVVKRFFVYRLENLEQLPFSTKK